MISYMDHNTTAQPAMIEVNGVFDFGVLCTIRRSYLAAADVHTVGAGVIRPFHLPHRSDFGLRGTADNAALVLQWDVLFV